MNRSIILIITICFVSVNLMFSPHLVIAKEDELDKISKELQEKQEEKSEIIDEQKAKEEEKKDLESTSQKLQGDIDYTHLTLAQAKAELEKVAAEKEQIELELTDKKGTFNLTARELYTRSNITPLEIMLTSDGFSDLDKGMRYYEVLVGQRLSESIYIAGKIADLNSQKELSQNKTDRLNQQIASLTNDKSKVSGQITNAEEVIDELKEKVEDIEGDISELSAKQQALIAKKNSATEVYSSVGDSEEAKQSLPDPGFSPAFAVFSFGYPHRVGMSQYGAFGRAKEGQGYEEILRAYYDGIDIEETDVPDEIELTGVGSVEFEDNYMKGIAEMPTSWGNEGGEEALKAQAVAARSYALSYTHNGERPICITQSCQVYNAGKAESSSAQAWHDAVEATRGIVMKKDGAIIKAYYASTAGGYTRLPTDFDVKWSNSPSYLKRIVDVDSSGKFYDGPGHGDSPWFKKAWYSSSDQHPWLEEDELADLLNCALLPEEYSDEIAKEEDGGMSAGDVVDTLKKEGISPITSVSSVTMEKSSQGFTSKLIINGSRHVDGKRFRTVFVLRSRGNLTLWSSLYEVTKR